MSLNQFEPLPIGSGLHTIGSSPYDHLIGQPVFSAIGTQVGRLRGRSLINNFGFPSGTVRDDGAVVDPHGLVRDWLERRPFPTIGSDRGLLGGSSGGLFSR